MAQGDTTAHGEITRAVADALMPQLHETAIRLADEIHAHIPSLGAGPEVFEDTRASCEANLEQIMIMLRDDRDPREATPPPAAVTYARTYAQQGQTLPELLRAYRLAQEALMRILLRGLSERLPHDQLLEAAEDASTFVFRYVDTVLEQLQHIYVAERERWVRSAAALRQQLVTGLLAGAPLDPAATSRRLGYELDRHHTGVVVWTEPAEEDEAVLRRLERATGQLAEQLGCTSPLTLSLGSFALAAWAGTWKPPSVEQLDHLRLKGESKGLSCAVGTTRCGVDGFRATHAEAVHARRVAQLSERSAGVVAYPSVALAALATENVEHARRFVEAELGPLLDAGDEGMRRLTGTLEVYFASGASVAATARRIGIHKNTVVYRLAQVAELLGRPVTERALELEVALVLARTLPPPDAPGP